MTAAQMRCVIYDAYPGDSWHEKVNNMPDDQVVAVYFSLLNREGKKKMTKREAMTKHAELTAERKRKFAEVGKDEQRFKPLVGEQLTLF